MAWEISEKKKKSLYKELSKASVKRQDTESPACGEDPSPPLRHRFATLVRDVNLSHISRRNSEVPSGTGVPNSSFQAPPGQLPSQGSPLPLAEYGRTP